MNEEFIDSRVRTHAVSFCREKCSEYSFRTSDEFRECVESCVKELLQLSRR
ncbi:MAG: hypothetical protein QN229_04740 [Desulfurococcaceae archaeon TW002]